MVAKTIPSYVNVDTQHRGHVFASRGNCLSEVYGHYSSAKAAAWEHCERLCSELDGHYLCVTSASCYFFSAQFEFAHPENGRPMVCHITPTQTCAMYLDMSHIETAREAWTRYVELYSAVRYTSDEWASHDGHCRVLWVGGYAYIVAYDEVYRVLDPYKRAGGLRKRIELQRVGAVDDAVLRSVACYDGHQALCKSVLPCHVRAVAGEHNRCVVYVHFVAEDDAPYSEFGVADVAMTVRCGLAVTLAMCVDACMMMHGSDAHGASVRLMD